MLSAVAAASSSSLLRRTSSIAAKKSLAPSAATSLIGKRWKSDDVGDVIGIDLGTTNSCVAIMVRRTITKRYGVKFCESADEIFYDSLDDQDYANSISSFLLSSHLSLLMSHDIDLHLIMRSICLLLSLFFVPC